MLTTWIYALISVIAVSLISFVGVLTIPIDNDKLKKIVIYFISFSAGALLGDAFIHLLPEVIEQTGYNLTLALQILSGIVAGLFLEKIICWRHCHMPVTKNHVHRFVYMNIFGDLVHNFIDGLTIGVSYMVNVPVGLATTLAIVFHEIPQEIGEFGVLIHGGFTKKKAILYNFLVSLSAVVGTILALIITNSLKTLVPFLIAFAVGNFIYIAGSDLIPELHKDEEIGRGIAQIVFFLLGILIMLLLLLYEKK